MVPNAYVEIGPLDRAIQRLEEGLARYRTDTSDTQIRDGLVQRFKFTYELGHKVLKRYLEYPSNPSAAHLIGVAPWLEANRRKWHHFFGLPKKWP